MLDFQSVEVEPPLRDPFARVRWQAGWEVGQLLCEHWYPAGRPGRPSESHSIGCRGVAGWPMKAGGVVAFGAQRHGAMLDDDCWSFVCLEANAGAVWMQSLTEDKRV